jgi:hypothetical protein
LIPQSTRDSLPQSRPAASQTMAARDSGNAADIEARTQVELAIADAKHCLGEGYAHYQVVFSDRIVIRRPGREETFQVSDFAPLAGALLVRPGTNVPMYIADYAKMKNMRLEDVHREIRRGRLRAFGMMALLSWTPTAGPDCGVGTDAATCVDQACQC